MGRGGTSGQRGDESSRLLSGGPLIWWGTSLFFIWYLLFYLGEPISYMIHRIFLPVLWLMSIIVITLTMSAIIEGMGWSRSIARYARPLMKMGGFSDHVGVAFTTAFLSGVAANTMLLNAYEEGRITQRELILANLLNTGLPSYFLHLPTTMAIIVPLVGWAGAVYLGITFFAALLRTVFITWSGHIFLKKDRDISSLSSEGINHTDLDEKRVYGWSLAKMLIKRYLLNRVLRIAYYTVPIYLGVVVTQRMGFFEWLQRESAHLIHMGAIPVESISIVVFTILAEFTAGAAVAGAMVHSGILTIKETVLALVFGNIIATPFRAIRHQLPRYMGIYRPRLGLTLLAAGQSLRLVSVIIVTLIYVTLI